MRPRGLFITQQTNNRGVDSGRKRAIETILTDRPLAYHPVLAKITGSATAGIFIAQILYWTPRSYDSDGWIYKSQAELYDETALSRREQETARTKLRQAGILDEQQKGMPRRLFYRAEVARIAGLIAKYDEMSERGEKWSLQKAIEEIESDEQLQVHEQFSQDDSQYGVMRHSSVAGNAIQESREPPDCSLYREYVREYNNKGGCCFPLERSGTI